jgi:hypothetical protein
MNDIKYYNTRTELLDLIPENSTILEIGVFKGDFSKEIINKTKFKKLFFVDIWQGEYGSGDKDGNNHLIVESMESVYISLYKQVLDNPDIHFIRMDSTNFLKNWYDKYFDAIYVDGDHTEEMVYSDLVLSLDKIKNGGLLMGHDYGSCWGVTNAVTKFCKEYNQPLIGLAMDRCQSFVIKVSK